MLRIILVFLALIAPAGVASAQWVTQEIGGAFDNDPLHVTLTMRGGYGFGFRCKSNTSEAIFITRDRSFDRETLKMANTVGPKILVRVDRGEILILSSEVHNTDGAATFVAHAELDIYRAIASARSSVAVAVEFLGTKYHETTFGVTGSRTAMNTLISKCKLER